VHPHAPDVTYTRRKLDSYHTYTACPTTGDLRPEDHFDNLDELLIANNWVSEKLESCGGPDGALLGIGAFKAAIRVRYLTAITSLLLLTLSFRDRWLANLWPF
jgi:hypothetical protein